MTEKPKNNAKFNPLTNDTNDYFEVIHINSWETLIENYNASCFSTPDKKKSINWLFRGEKGTAGLKSEFDKAAVAFEFDSAEISRPKFEKELIRKFVRQYHFFSSPPEGMASDKMERGIANKGYWLSIMRHHEAPTRLLDWSYSFFIAVFFALNSFRKVNEKENCQEETKLEDCVVWAINDKWLTENAKVILDEKYFKDDPDLKCKYENVAFKDDALFEACFFRKNDLVSFVHTYTPFYLNQRLNLQQGTFLCPGDITKAFKDNLFAVLDKAEKEEGRKANFIKFVFTDRCGMEARKKILYNLYKMNISQATLFPGLEGFSKSLRMFFAFPKVLDPSVGEK